VGSFGSYYPAAMDTLLHDNADAFNSRDCRPLVPTRAKHVYANRFLAPEKTLWTIYNNTGHTFFGEVLAVTSGPEEHVVDLLRCREADIQTSGDEQVVHLFLARDDVTCLAVLPKRISVTRTDDTIEAAIRSAAAGWTVSLCDAAGLRTVSAPVANGSARFNLGEIPEGTPAPSCVKLHDGRRLIDMIPTAK
jgi:hypothetical protein